MKLNRSQRQLLWAGCLVTLAAGCASCRFNNPPVLPLVANVVEIREEYANINTDLSGRRLEIVGITQGSTFAVRFRDDRIEVMLGQDYNDVDRGEWVGLIEEDGNLQIAISFGHAATVLECVAGDTLFVTPINVLEEEKKGADAQLTDR